MAYDQHFPGFPYATPVPNAKSRFVELLQKHALPLNKFINEHIEIGLDDLTNLDHPRFVELCTFFQLNPIEKIRFEKLVNELCFGEEHLFNHNKNPGIDTYNHNKTIPTSKQESLLIRQLDNEHDKMQYISKMAEFMLTRINDKCSMSHQQIDKIFDTQKENILNILNAKKHKLHNNITAFNHKQSLFIQNQLKNIDEYQAEIRQTRNACSNVLESQQYGEDREDTISQIIQSLLSIHANHNNYRNAKELNKNLGEISQEITVECEPMIIESCIDKLVMIDAGIDDDMIQKIDEINQHYNAAAVQPIAPYSVPTASHSNNHHNQRTLDNDQNHNRTHAVSQSMYSLSQYNKALSADLCDNNPHPSYMQNRSNSYSQIMYNEPCVFNNIAPDKRASFACNEQLRNRPYSFAYNDQSYPPITFKNNSNSNPVLHMNGINELEMDQVHQENHNHIPHFCNSQSPPFGAQLPVSFSQLPVNGYNANSNGQMGAIQIHNSANSSGSGHSEKSAPGQGQNQFYPPVPVLTQSHSNHEDDGDIQAFIQETIQNIDDDEDEDEEHAHSIEAMYEPGPGLGKLATTSNTPNTPMAMEQKEEKHEVNGNIDITNSDYLDCNPIEILQDIHNKEQKEHHENFINCIAVPLPVQMDSAAVAVEIRSRPNSIQSAVSSHHSQYMAKWAVYGVGNNMSYELGLNHNNNLSTFQQMDWEIDDTPTQHEEEDEKKEIIDETNGIVQSRNIKNVFNDCLALMTNGPGWHMYLFGGGQLYCCGSNASGCFSMGKHRKGTYIQTLTQHSYFKTNDIKLGYLSTGNSGHHSFVITEMNDIYALGESSHYELALDSDEMAKNKTNYWPERISFFDKVIISKIGTGKKFSIFVSGHGVTYACGTNLFGALGFGDEMTTLRQPKVIDRVNRAKIMDVCCGENHSVILDASGKVWTFGINNQGQLGRNTKNNLDYPAVVNISGRKFSVGQSQNRMAKIASGCNHIAVVSESCKLFLWGANERGQLGDGTQKVRYKAKQLLKAELIGDICCGPNHTVIITKKRKVFVCGCNEYYQCRQVQQDGFGSESVENIILRPILLTFENQPDIDQQIKRIFAGHNSTFVAVDTNMHIDRLCV